MAAINGLKRVAKVYGLLERMRSAELAVATGRVAEAEQAIVEARRCREECGAAGRAALLLGDRQRWLVAETERMAGLTTGRHLESVRLDREALRAAALVEYRASYLQTSQVRQAIETRVIQEQLEGRRRVQAIADERYLSRRAWMQGQKNVSDQMTEG